MKRKFNKKLLTFGVLGLFALALVTASVLIYYGQIHQTVSVEQAVVLGCSENVCSEGINAIAGDTSFSNIYNLTNNANTPRNVNLVTTYPAGNADEITTSYTNEVKELQLVRKQVVFGGTNWEFVGDQITVKYTVNGDKFMASVDPSVDTPEQYVLIYYADNANRFNNVAKAINVNDVDASLPYEGDANADSELYNYCNTEENYFTCNGAKIWYVPLSAIDEDKNINWTRADEFYFETDLITYDSQNTNPLTVEGGETIQFIVAHSFNELSDGVSGTITTSVLPA